MNCSNCEANGRASLCAYLQTMHGAACFRPKQEKTNVPQPAEKKQASGDRG